MASQLKEDAMLAIVDRAAREGASLVLRGGLVMRELIAPLRRPVDDVDFLALCSEREAREILLAFGTHDRTRAHEFSMGPLEPTWVETEFPGLRTQCTVRTATGAIVIQIDVGFGDPRAFPERPFRLEGMREVIAAVGLETMLGWKIHGLFERGDGAWRAKDLVDVHDLAARCNDDQGAARCLRLAFSSRGDDFSICERFLYAQWGQSRGSRRKWRRFRRVRAEFDPEREFPEDLQEFVELVRGYVAPLVAAARQLSD